MKKTLILSGALAGMLTFSPAVQAASDNFSFKMSVYLPPAVATLQNDSQVRLMEETVTRGHDVDLFVEEKLVMGEKILVKTSVLR